jgi:HD-like signal output (HDOD) protein
MIRVLFVDDEPNVLAGLRRMLRTMGPDWDLRFCASAPDALVELQREPYDAIVSDMRMPVMDGAELLEQVSRAHPGMIRIMLSGQPGRESVLRAVGPAHQYLSKPCDADTIKTKLRQAIGLRNVLTNPALQRVVAQLHGLPSVPAVYLDLMAAMQSERASLAQIGAIVERDAAMTAKILQLVNSPYFGLRARITSAAQAVQLLGLDLVRTLILTTHVFSSLNPATMQKAGLNNVWQHSLLVSKLARVIAVHEGLSQAVTTEAVTSAILHDIGRVVLASCLPDQYAAIAAEAKASDEPLTTAEKKVFGCTHAEVGAYLLGLWGLPDAITITVAYHDRPQEAGERELGALLLVHVADAIDRELSIDTREPIHLAEMAFLEELGLASHYETWVTLCRCELGLAEDKATAPQTAAHPA